MSYLIPVDPAEVARYMVEKLGTSTNNIIEDYSWNLLDALEDLYGLERMVTGELEKLSE